MIDREQINSGDDTRTGHGGGHGEVCRCLLDDECGDDVAQQRQEDHSIRGDWKRPQTPQERSDVGQLKERGVQRKVSVNRSVAGVQLSARSHYCGIRSTWTARRLTRLHQQRTDAQADACTRTTTSITTGSEHVTPPLPRPPPQRLNCGYHFTQSSTAPRPHHTVTRARECGERRVASRHTTWRLHNVTHQTIVSDILGCDPK